MTNADRSGLALDDTQWNTLLTFLNNNKPTKSERLSGIVIDTGASHHLTGKLDLLFDVFDIVLCLIGNDTITMAIKKGKLYISGSVTLSLVLLYLILRIRCSP